MAGAAFRRSLPVQFLTDGDMSADVTSDWVENKAGLNEITILYKFTGIDVNGEIFAEADASPFPHSTPDVYDLALTPSATLTGTNGTGSIVLSAPVSRWRIRYDRTAGTGTLSANWQGHQQ
jgi:hypothetical protein